MDGIIINELSLNGQFLDSRGFLEERNASFSQGIAGCPFTWSGVSVQTRKFFAAQATPDKTLHDLLTAPETRIIDEARLYKSTLARASVIRFGMKLPSRTPMSNIQWVKPMYPAVPLPKQQPDRFVFYHYQIRV